MGWWQVGAIANAIILCAYLAIALNLVRSFQRHGGWRANPMAVATAGIFFTAAVHHGLHPVQQLLGAGGELGGGASLRRAFDGWGVALWDVVTAAVALWYWAVRNRLPAVLGRASLFGAADERERQALEIHDNVVQGVATAKMAFELEDHDRGLRALDQTLTSARRIITELLDDSPRVRVERRDLRRDHPAGGTS